MQQHEEVPLVPRRAKGLHEGQRGQVRGQVTGVPDVWNLPAPLLDACYGVDLSHGIQW